MADLNLRDFYVRLGRIEKIRRSGGGFEAAGTLGLSHYTRQERAGIPVFRPLLLVFLAVILIKGVIHYQVGAETYAARVGTLIGGTQIDKIGAFVMQADPLTVFVSDQIRDVVN